MKAQRNAYLNSLDREFGKLRELYSRYFGGYSLVDDNGELIKQNRNRYQKEGLASDAPIINLYDLVVNWFEGRNLINEVKYNHAIKNDNYFEFFQNVLHTQHAFLNNEFSQIILDYLNDEDEGRQYVADFEGGCELDDEDFFTAIRFQLVQITLWLEDQYHQANPIYRPLLNKPDRQCVPGSNHIRLSYGSQKEEIMQLIYEKLNGPYFDVDYNEFVKHFMPQTSFEKIRWTGSLSSLVFLFYGKYQDGEILTRLKVANNALKLISDHFVKADGSSFNQDSISALPQKIENVKKIRDSDAIIALLKRVA